MSNWHFLPKIVNKTSFKLSCNGGHWQKQVALDQNADQAFNSDNLIRIVHDSLLKIYNFEIQDLIDIWENILTIGVYKCPLKEWQLVQVLDCHQFVVIQTTNWWYSIEKNDKFIYIQRAKNLTNVQCYISGDQRKTDILQISVDCGKGTMRDLIGFLYTNNELNIGYDILFCNCQAFAKRIFDKFAASNEHGRVLGCSPPVKIIPPWQN